MTRLLRNLTVFVFVLAVTGLASGQSDPRIGTWKLNVAKSKFDSAASRKNERRTYQMSAGAVMVHAEVILSDAASRKCHLTARRTAKITPITPRPRSMRTQYP